jgi:site-specific recombinase XerC
MEINNKILEEYFSYLTVIKARSPHTIAEFRVDLRLLFIFVAKRRKPSSTPPTDCSFADIKFIKSITLDDMYAFIAYLQKERNCSVATCARKIISIRQFWKYLKTKAHLIENNITEELEVPKQAKRMPKYLSLEDSIRLLMSVEDSPRNYCIVTLFLNCALRLAELTNLNVEQISAQSVTVIGKGDKERQIYLTPAAKNAVNAWLIDRNKYHPKDNALFISNRGIRLTTRAIQIVVKNAIEAAGLSQDITPRKLRHTAATLLYKHGHVDIRALKEILGHESLITTEIYTHLDNQQLQTAVNTNPLAGMVNRRQGVVKTMSP